MNIPPEIKEFANWFSSSGGRCLLIGGGVIDSITGRSVKDWDIEIYNLSLGEIITILSSHNISTDLVGQAFGVIKARLGNLDLDISIPRRENKIGISHKDFEIQLDPNMSPREAGRRRDLTINSMYLDLDNGELIDPFGGLKDLQKGIIRETDPETFKEDPLRVMRVMQLLPRKGKRVAASLVNLCRGITEEFHTLPKERLFEEWKKLLLKAEKPSTGLRFLRMVNWLQHFPELEALVDCNQRLEWHPEGSVWEHTLQVTDMAARLKNNLPEEWRLAYMFAALLHDVGKPSTTKPDLTAWGHDTAGAPIALQFMERLSDDRGLLDKVSRLVRYHMAPGQLYMNFAKVAAWKRLHNNIRLDVIGALSRADSLSRYTENEKTGHGPSEVAMKYFLEFGEEPITPVLLGRHLITAGLKPGKQFGTLLRQAYEIQISEDIDSVERLLQRVLSLNE